jgi:hypothetical protein
MEAWHNLRDGVIPIRPLDHGPSRNPRPAGPVGGLVLPPLWRQGYKGQPTRRISALGAITPAPGRGPQAPVAAPRSREPSCAVRGGRCQRDGDGRRGGVGRTTSLAHTLSSRSIDMREIRLKR